MRKWLRIRGAIGMGVVWGAAWAAVASIPRWLFGVNADAPFPLIFGVLGFITGVAFSALVLLAERRRTFDQMSIPRFAGWGALGGFLVSALFARFASLGMADVLVIAPTFAAASAFCAAGSLAVARRGPRPALPAGRGSTGEAQLSEPEQRKLPGDDD